MTEEGVQDRCRGVLLGLAAGDRNGGPIRMAVRLAESLLALGRFDPADIVGRYLHWWREGAFDPGPVSGRALELMAAGMSALEAPGQVHREFAGRTAGCNPAHRCTPLAMLAALADEASGEARESLGSNRLYRHLMGPLLSERLTSPLATQRRVGPISLRGGRRRTGPTDGDAEMPGAVGWGVWWTVSRRYLMQVVGHPLGA
jgi:hypothetical protein